MTLLLDTHIALWAIDDPALLGEAAVARIEAAEAVHVSVVSICEIAIKHALRRGRHDDIGMTGGQANNRFLEAGFLLLPVTAAHAVAVVTLPPLHGDPFDRMLVAQALSEPMHLLTRDARLMDYGTLIVQV